MEHMERMKHNLSWARKYELKFTVYEIFLKKYKLKNLLTMLKTLLTMLKTLNYVNNDLNDVNILPYFWKFWFGCWISYYDLINSNKRTNIEHLSRASNKSEQEDIKSCEFWTSSDMENLIWTSEQTSRLGVRPTTSAWSFLQGGGFSSKGVVLGTRRGGIKFFKGDNVP